MATWPPTCYNSLFMLLTHIRVTRVTQWVLLTKHWIWFHVFWCVIQRSENMCKSWPLIAPTFSQLYNVTFICIPWFCICKWRKFREMTTYPCQFLCWAPKLDTRNHVLSICKIASSVVIRQKFSNNTDDFVLKPSHDFQIHGNCWHWR